MVERCSHFAAIGSGTYVAESALFYREHTGGESLGTAIYNVYEAMKLGAKAPGVGEKFSLHIASADDDPNNITWDEITDDLLRLPRKAVCELWPEKN